MPLNLADILILTKNQLLMGYRIALGAGKSGRARDVIGEVLGVVGGGFLFRQAARSLVGLIPMAGLIPKVAIAYTGTWAIGRAVVLWATQGRRVSPATPCGRLSRDAAGRGRAFARGPARRPQRPLSAREVGWPPPGRAGRACVAPARATSATGSGRVRRLRSPRG